MLRSTRIGLWLLSWLPVFLVAAVCVVTYFPALNPCPLEMGYGSLPDLSNTQVVRLDGGTRIPSWFPSIGASADQVALEETNFIRLARRCLRTRKAPPGETTRRGSIRCDLAVTYLIGTNDCAALGTGG